MHLEVALISEQILTVARIAVGLVGARASRLGSVVLAWGRRPFLARLEQLVINTGAKEENKEFKFMIKRSFMMININVSSMNERPFRIVPTRSIEKG